MEALEYLMAADETRVLVFLAGWLAGCFVAGVLWLVAVK